MEGVKYVLSDKFNQDPPEEHFEKQRARGGGIKKLFLKQYIYNERKIIVSKPDMIIKGNTRGRKDKKVSLTSMALDKSKKGKREEQKMVT